MSNDLDDIRRAAENAIRMLNSPAVQAALESQRRNHEIMAKVIANSTAGELQRRVAASAVYIEAQQRMMTQVMGSIAARPALFEQVSQAIATQDRVGRVAAQAFERWLARDDIRPTLSRLATSAAARDSALVDIEADRREVEALVSAPPPAQEGLGELDQALALNPETEHAVDKAASQLMVSFPSLTRAHARWLVVVIVYIGSAGALLGASLIPLLAAIPGILGWDAPAAGEAAGRAFDKLVPPKD